MAIDHSDFSSFGALLRAFRTDRCLTQQQLAEKLGIRRNTIGTWERGDFLPGSKGIVLELARHLHLGDHETRQLLEASLSALSPHWLVPLPRNPFFTGREQILKTLHADLCIDQTAIHSQTYALYGLGGVGKTQIALEYAYQHALEYGAVFWIGAETDESIISSLLRIVEVLQLPGRADKDQYHTVAAVQSWLSTHSQWLLIWDNIEDLEWLDRFLPPTRAGAILLTTRSPRLGTRAQGMDLLPMQQEEGVLFLLRRAKVLEARTTNECSRQFAARMPSQYAAAAELATAMGGLPLALDQAGAYIEENQCDLMTYLELFRTHRSVLLLQRGDGSREHPAPVSTTFTLAITAAAGSHSAVGDLLRVCALLQADNIPEELFRQGAEHLGGRLQTACRDTLEWNRVCAITCSYSLLSRQPEERMLSLHRLVQAVLMDAMTEVERKLWTRRIISALDEVFPVMRSATEHAALKQGERLLPHALLSLQQSVDAETSLTLASLAYKVAQYLHERGQYIQAEPLYRRALRIYEQEFGLDHPEVASLLNSLAILYWVQGKYVQAEPLYQRAINIQEQALGPNHLEIARPLNNLANLYWSQGKYTQAEQLHLRAHSIREQALGLDHLDVITSLNNLAALYTDRGKYTQAEPLLQRSLCIREQRLDPDHHLVAFSLSNLAELYQKQGRHEQAEAFHRRALRIREQTLGSDHYLVAASLNNLAQLALEKGEYIEAEQLLQRARSIWEATLGPEHPYVALVLGGLASLSTRQGNYVPAQALYQRALRVSERSLGPEHPDVAILLGGLANLFSEQRRYTRAEPLYQRSLSLREQYLGKNHPETAQTLHDLAIFRQRQGNLSEALSLAERALSIRSQSLMDIHPHTVTTRALYTQLLQAQACAQKGSPSTLKTEEIPAPPKKELHVKRASLLSDDTLDPSSCEDDLLQRFFNARCELHPRAWCPSRDLWQAYRCWVEQHQERYPLSRGVFTAQLKAHGCRADRTRTARIWRGIALHVEDW